VRRVVQGREGRQVGDLAHDLVVHEHGRREHGTAVHDAVADRVHVGVRERGADLVEQAEGDAQRLAVVRDRLLARRRVPGEPVLDDAGVLADALDRAGGDGLAADGVDELVLERGRPRVHDEHGPVRAVRAVRVRALALGQDRHEVAPWGTGVVDGAGTSAGACAWIAVMATVLTMSCTSAPRERSFTGLLRPWRTGPTATAPAERCTAL